MLHVQLEENGNISNGKKYFWNNFLKKLGFSGTNFSWLVSVGIFFFSEPAYPNKSYLEMQINEGLIKAIRNNDWKLTACLLSVLKS